MATTKKPSGLSITRSGNLKFALSWKIADNNYDGGQQLEWRIWKTEKKTGAWTNLTLGTSATSKTITLSAGSYYPNTNTKIYAFEFCVRGKKSDADWSAWTYYKWKLSAPAKPVVTSELTQSNQTVFTYDSDVETNDNKPFHSYEWQTIRVKDSKVRNGADLNWWTSNAGWDTGTPSSSGSKTITEDAALLAGNSYTRWFRVRTRGAAGLSAWAYAKHVYAKPFKPKIVKATSAVSSGNTNVVMTWTAANNPAHPIDEVAVEYCIATPRANLDIPAAPSWTEATTVADTAETDSVNFTVSAQAADDECFFVRVVAKHDTAANDNPSKYALAGLGTLSKPTNLNVTLNSSYKASITVENNSTVPDSRVAIVYRGTNGKEITIGVTSAGAGSKTLTRKQCPTTSSSAKFYAYAFQGSYKEKSRKDGVSSYTIDANMTSGRVYDSAAAPDVPVEPENFTVTRSGNDAVLTWDWSWDNATGIIISWSTDKNAWQSTNEPSSYTINGTWMQSWRVANIEVGKIWYFRARFIGMVNDNEVRGPSSSRISLDLTAVPETPLLTLSKAVVRPGGSQKASWTYSSSDGTKQAAAEVCQALNVVNGVPTSYGYRALKTTTKKSGTFQLDDNHWTVGTTYNLAVRVTSSKDKISDWSDPVPFYYGKKMSCTLGGYTNFSSITITDSDGNTRTAFSLTELPASVTVTGAGAGGITTLVIERAEAYYLDRPDGSFKDGYKGETIFFYQQTGEDSITIEKDNLTGILDDGALYRIVATVEDGNGQSAKKTRQFEVHWNHQPQLPNAEVTIQNDVAVITATADNTAIGDTIDIYRLSTDNPQLIVQGGTFGTAYVDPYPALGENAGYRIVNISKYGDYITAGNQPAWTDEMINIDNATGYIHFNGEVIPVDLNVELSSTWVKDFKQTHYLGGTIRGDWNAGVTRSGSVSLTVPTSDTETIQAIRRLADYPGICHVRTQDGSSFAADIQVAGNTGYSVAGKVEIYTLSITRIDPQELDGMTLDEWVNQ